MTKKKRTELDRQIELQQRIENRVYSIFFDAIKNQKSHEQILSELYDYLDNYSDVSTLPRYMKAKITGASEALFRLIDWYFIESRYDACHLNKGGKIHFLNKEQVDENKISWSDVKYIGSFWKQVPHNDYSSPFTKN